MFTLEVPALYFVFPLLSLHTLHYTISIWERISARCAHMGNSCYWKWQSDDSAINTDSVSNLHIDIVTTANLPWEIHYTL